MRINLKKELKKLIYDLESLNYSENTIEYHNLYSIKKHSFVGKLLNAKTINLNTFDAYTLLDITVKHYCKLLDIEYNNSIILDDSGVDDKECTDSMMTQSVLLDIMFIKSNSREDFIYCLKKEMKILYEIKRGSVENHLTVSYQQVA